MKTRIITAIIALPFLIIPIYLGGLSLYVMIFLLSIIGIYELLNAYKVKDTGLYIIAALMTLSYYLLLRFNLRSYFSLAIVTFLIVLLIYYVMYFQKIKFEEITITFISFFYITYLISHILLIRENNEYGFVLVWLVFIIAFGSDTFAYFSGKLLGKHKLAKNLSPNKTIEGSIGGIIGAIILTLTYGYFMKFPDLILLGILGGVGSIVSQFGDLTASAIKRQTGIKDFGKLLPGHGGILDRFDSNFFTAPFVYYIMMLFI